MPPYIREIARSIEKSGKTLESAISIAVSRVKVWASGKGVTEKTQAKAAKALAAWEKLKSKAKAKKIAASSLTIEELDALADEVRLSAFEEDHLRLSHGVDEMADPGMLALSRVLRAAE